jgi:hypothetical protein
VSGFAGRALTAGTTSSAITTAIMAIAMAIISGGIIILFFVLVVPVAVFVLPIIFLLSIPKEQPHIVGQVGQVLSTAEHQAIAL